jgi:hypothetical protein
MAKIECTHCKKPIDDSAMGMMFWRTDKASGKVIAWRIAHKVTCDPGSQYDKSAELDSLQPGGVALEDILTGYRWDSADADDVRRRLAPP